MNKIKDREGYVNVVLGTHSTPESIVQEYPLVIVSYRFVDELLGNFQEGARMQGYDFSELPNSIRESVLAELLDAYEKNKL
jgi:hypothetical protein